MKPVTRFLRNNLVGTKGICITLCALLLAVTVYIFTRNVDQDKYSVELSYKEGYWALKQLSAKNIQGGDFA